MYIIWRYKWHAAVQIRCEETRLNQLHFTLKINSPKCDVTGVLTKHTNQVSVHESARALVRASVCQKIACLSDLCVHSASTLFFWFHRFSLLIRSCNPFPTLYVCTSCSVFSALHCFFNVHSLSRFVLFT